MMTKTGYGNPPTDKQFKKGQSGNPTGRPKASKALTVGLDIQASLQRVLSRKIKASESGKTKNITFLDAYFTRVMMQGLKGDSRDINNVRKVIKDFKALLMPVATDDQSHSIDSIMERVMSRSKGGLPPKRQE